MKNLILACSLVFSATVNASLISTDWLNANDGLITTDTASGLDWLDLSETYGMRLADASALFGTTFAGFRFATHTEVLGFMGHAGLPTPASPFNSTVSSGNAAHIAAQQLMTSLVGETVGAGFGYTYFGSRGLVSELSGLGGTYLIAVNGTDKLMQFDGTSWQFIDGVTSPSITGLATTELAHVEVFKERLWFVEKDSMSAWYLPTKQVGGALTEFPLGQLFSRGGYLAAMGTWTIDSGTGVDDYAIFVTSEGEVGVYQGTDPASASTFQLVGVYYIAPPIGRKCFTKYGGDMLLLTTAGLFPLSKALMSSGMERSLAISDRIAPTFQKSAEVYGVNSGWEALVIPFENMVLVNVPTVEGYSSNQLVMNTITQSWALFTGWNAFCWEVWQGQVFFGGDGIVAKALYGNEDFSANITGKVRTAFDYFGSQKIKHIKMFRPVLSADGNFSADFGIDVDFEDIDRTTTLAVASAATFEWDSALWDSALWAGDQSVQRQWRTVAAKEGFCLSLRLRVAAKGVIVRWNSTDFLYQRGGVL